jgi:hypothetical protein
MKPIPSIASSMVVSEHVPNLPNPLVDVHEK